MMNIPYTGSHLDHMIRQTRMHHVQLSSMADVKANMMLTLSALVTTFLLNNVKDPFLRWPALVMIFFCLLTILASAYAVMPKVNFTRRPNLENPNCNILFFGNFMNLDYDEFRDMMETVMADPGKVYEAQIREVYELGVFLGYKKYRYVRLAYLFFITGFLISGVTLIVVEVVKSLQ